MEDGDQDYLITSLEYQLHVVTVFRADASSPDGRNEEAAGLGVCLSAMSPVSFLIFSSSAQEPVEVEAGVSWENGNKKYKIRKLKSSTATPTNSSAQVCASVIDIRSGLD